MARPRKPTVLKFQAGERRKERLNPDEPKPEIHIPDYPKHLHGEALREWKRMAATLEKLGLLSDMDRAALAGYCSAWATYVEAEKEIRKDGAVIVTIKGNHIQSPWMGIRNTALLLMHKFLVEFGLTPAARTRVKAPKASEKENRWSKIG